MVRSTRSVFHFRLTTVTAFIILTALLPMRARAQDIQPNSEELSRQVAELTNLVRSLQARVDTLEAEKSSGKSVAGTPAASSQTSESLVSTSTPTSPAASTPPPAGNDLLRGTTVNFLLDGYYGNNFNNPIGRVNLQRAYDVASNSFSLNQADIVLENAADPANGKRLGLRLDLQFGQATETLQGNASNELALTSGGIFSRPTGRM